ncbi:MAG: alanine--tRNA ligase, partial [Nitrospinota bacterium]
MTGSDVRRMFLDYFQEKGHRIVRSSLLVPANDPTLLFTNAGMVQFKDVFTGLDRRDYARATSSQKCLRVSGKHNDLENVGRTARHHTFFEMLGNFSFGDYFKEKAIEFAWELLVGRLGLDGERMWVTVFREDDEAAGLWQRLVGVPAARIVRRDEKDNFWAMGDTGPCGPCSELIYDQGPHIPGGAPGSGADEDGDRYLELWNLVFMQFNRGPSGKLTPLPKPSVDTGMGLERLTAVLQKQTSNFHTDLLAPVIRFAEERCGKAYRERAEGPDVSYRVIADHARAASFLVADGVLPSNEGRGYVLRQVARRAMRHGRLLGIMEPFLHQAAGVVAEMMGEAFPELRESLNYISRVILSEEERFSLTLAQVQPRIDETCEEYEEMLLNPAAATIDIPKELAKKAFYWSDTFGYPWDLVVETATAHGLTVDRATYEQELNLQRERARAHWKGSGEEAVARVWHEVREAAGATAFLGYGRLEAQAKVVGVVRGGARCKRAGVGEEAEVVLSQTPFYGESGGQEGDRGRLTWPEGAALVLDTQKPLPDLYVHRVRVERGVLAEGLEVEARADAERRGALRLNHTATHLLQHALRQVLGDHVKQAGSHLSPERLRFDYTHFAPPAPREREAIEDLVNRRIRENAPVATAVMPIDEALATGATALFGERYGEQVRVVSVGDFSRELCGGTHASAAGEIGLFRILHEGSVASGVRRIEAATGEGALLQTRKETGVLSEIGELMKSPPLEEAQRVRRLVERVKALEREVRQLRERRSSEEAGGLAAGALEVKGVKVLAARQDGLSPEELRQAVDAARGRLKSGVAVLISVTDGKVAIAAGVTKDLTSRIHAGNLVRDVAAQVGGKGGGRADFAQAGGKDPGKVDEALAKEADARKRCE